MAVARVKTVVGLKPSQVRLRRAIILCKRLFVVIIVRVPLLTGLIVHYSLGQACYIFYGSTYHISILERLPTNNTQNFVIWFVAI